MVRQRGVLELIAASASRDHFKLLGPSSFTRALTELLRTRAGQNFLDPFSAAELHAKLWSTYHKMIEDHSPEKELVTSFPSPLHMQASGNTRLPSILLAPVTRPSPSASLSDNAGQQMNLTVRLADGPLNVEAWTEWFRSMPDGVRDVKLEGPYR